MSRLRTSLVIALVALGLGRVEAGRGDLLSLKKGGEDGKAWAVFYFDETVPWIGISQPQTEKLSLYFQSRADEFRGSLVQIGSYTLYFQQMRENPPIFRIDILYEGDVPLAIVQKENLLVLSLNDPRFSPDAFAPAEPVWPSLSLVGVTQTIEGERVQTRLAFDGEAFWRGFIRMNRENPKLLLGGVWIRTPDHEYWFEEGDLSNLVFQLTEGTETISVAHLNFSAGASYSIVCKGQEIFIETSVKGRLLPPEEGGVARTEAREAPIAMAPDTEAVIPQRTPVSPTIPSPSQRALEPPPPVSEDSLLDAQRREAHSETAFRLLDAQRQSAWSSSPSDGSEPLFPSSSAPLQEVPATRTFQRSLGSTIPWDEPVSFEFRATPLVDALRTIAVSYDLNMVIAEGVKGEVTLSLKNISLKRALDNIIHLNGCEYTVEDDIITVKPVRAVYKGGMITRIYRLKYADAENVKSVVGKIASNDTMVQVFYPEFLNFSEAGKNRMNYNKVAVQGIRRASILIVTDTQDKIEAIDQVISELDKAPAQILIKSKLVEVAPEVSRNLGIDWEQSLTLMQEFKKSPSGKESTLELTSKSLTNEPFNLVHSLSLGQISETQYMALLDFLRTKTNAKLISNPSLLAMDNEEASISVGTTVPVPQIQRGTGGTGDMVTFQYKEVNIQLNVSPHISRQGEIIMFINPIIEEITGWVELGISRAPITAKRSVNSIVTVKDGATLVVGGLIKTQRVRTVKKVWLLGDIPLIGPLFQHEKFEDKETNLLIFITPKIVST